ncbi:MAG: tetratricopeptide repeat protein, partial [Gammaproteobacteria bacterium]
HNRYEAVDNTEYAYWETQGWYHLCYDLLLRGEQHAITAAMRREDGYRWENTARSGYLHTLGTRLIRTGQVYQVLSWYTQWFRQSRQDWQGNGAVLHYFVCLMGTIAQVYRNEALTLLPQQSSTENFLSEGIAYRNSLTRERATLEKQLPHQPRAAIEQWNYHLYGMVRDIARQVDELFEDKEESHPRCLVLLGSLSREMAVAYSDVECGLLVEDNDVFAGWDKDRPTTGDGEVLYRWFMAIEMIISSMHDSGFVLDSNAQPRIEPALRGTPDTLIKKLTHAEVTAEDGLVYSLLHPRFGYGRIGLYQNYLKQLHQAWKRPCTRTDVQRLPWESPQLVIPYHRYWATAQIGRNRQGWETYSATCPTSETLPDFLDIKKPFLKSLTFFPLDIALYHGIETHQPWQGSTSRKTLKQYTLPALIKRLVERGYMDKTQGKRWQEEWEGQLYHRCAHQLANAGADSLAITEASEEIRASYQKRHELLSRWVQRLSIWESQGYRPFQQAGWLSELLHRSDNFDASPALVDGEHQVIPSDCTLQILSPAYSKPLVLHPDWEAALFDEKTGKVKPTTTPRNSGVFIRGDTVLKVLLPDETDEEAQKAVVTTYIAREQLTQTLAHLCQWSVVPLGVGGIVTRKGVRYGVWLSETVVGQDMTALVLPKQKGGPFRSLEETTSDKTKSLHHWSSGALLLLNLLLSPEDMHPKNLRWTGYQWVSVDNKRMWVKPSSLLKKWFGGTKEEYHHKSILYALAPRIQWATFFKTHFLGLLPQPLIREWTSQMQGWDKQVAALLGYESQAEGWRAATLGPSMPLLLQFQWAFMQKKMKSGLTPQELIRVWVPSLAKNYRELRQRARTDKELIEGFYQQFNYRLGGVTKDSAGFVMNTPLSDTSVVQINAQRLALEDFQREYFPVLREDLQAFDWGTYTPSEQKILLYVLRVGELTHLNLTGCRVAQETDVKALIQKSPRLETLNLTEQSFPETVLEAITNRHRSLTTLIWDGHPRLRKIYIGEPLKRLKVLSLQHCLQLEAIELHETSQLEELRLMDSPHAVVTPESKRQALATAYFNRGVAEYRLGRYAEALGDFDEALRLDPAYALAYHNRGCAKYRLGRYAEALGDFDEALRLNPALAAAYSNRGNVKQSLGRCAEALGDFDEALRLDPALAVAYYNRGYVKQCQGRYQGALLDYQKALHYTSNGLTAAITRTYRCAYLLHALGHKASSALQVSKALALIPAAFKANPIVANEQPLTEDVMQQWRYYLKLLLLEGSDDRAAVVAKHTLLLNEDYPHPWLIHYVRMEVAEFAMRNKQYEWVQDILDTLPEDGPWDVELKSHYYQLQGRLCLQRGEIEEAGNAIAAALKTNPSSGESNVWACHYYQQCGQWDKAIEYGVMALLRLPVVCEEREQLKACWQEAGMASHSLPVLSLQEAIQAGYRFEDSPLVWSEEWNQLEDGALLQQVVNQRHQPLLTVTIGIALEAGADKNVIIQERQLYTPEIGDHQETMDASLTVTWVLLKWEDTYAVIEMEAPLWFEAHITEEMLHDIEEESDTSLSPDNAVKPPSPSSVSQSASFFSIPLPAANDMTIIFKQAQDYLAAGDERMKDNKIEKAVVHYEQGIALLASLEADERTGEVETLFTTLTELLEGAQSLLEQSPSNQNLAMGGL